MTRTLLAALLATTLGTPLLADLTPWGQAGDWIILTDPDHDNGCLAQVSLSDGTLMRIGLDKPGAGTGYITSVNPEWETKMGQKFDVTIAFAETTFVGKGKGVRIGDVPGIEVKADNIDLLVNLAKAESVHLSAGGPGIEVALKGSYDALSEMMVCQSLQK